jgi:hypothetical protein
MADVEYDNTVIGHLNAALGLIEQHKSQHRQAYDREFALAVTAIEDAQMRFTRGYAMLCGVFNPAHLELQMGPGNHTSG